MQRKLDFDYKVAQIRHVLACSGYDAVEIRSQTNFSYLTRGRGFIGLASTEACGQLIVTADRIYLISENMETQRLYQEQLDQNPDITCLSYPWQQPAKRSEVVAGVLEGLRVANETDLAHEFWQMRTVISEYDLVNYRALCIAAANILEEICFDLQKGMTEYELAGEISARLWANNIEPITLLIAFDERALSCRHPVMVGRRLENYALIGICGRQNGLITSVSRDVLLVPDPEMEAKHQHCAEVQAAFWDALRPGQTLDQIFRAGKEAYRRAGFPEEFKEHHQGGLTGYVAREMRVNDGCEHLVRAGEAYAFNPTIQGAKCEDTVYVGDEGVEVLTYTGNYAYVMQNVCGRSIPVATVWIKEKRKA